MHVNPIVGDLQNQNMNLLKEHYWGTLNIPYTEFQIPNMRYSKPPRLTDKCPNPLSNQQTDWSGQV